MTARSAPANEPGIDVSLAGGTFDAPELPSLSQHGLDASYFERTLLGPASEFLARPGKAFRARIIESSFALCLEARLLRHDAEPVPRACLEAIELLHAGSLIVDDIQDDGHERRGGPALHRTIGTPRALNTGNWLYFVALSRLHELPLGAADQLEVLRRAHRCLSHCHEGQALDLGLRVGEVRKLDLAAVAMTCSRLKTGALMGFAAALGGFAAQAPRTAIDSLAGFGEQVGIALQMLDDLGAFVAEARRHKALEDLRAERLSWAWAFAADALDEVTFMKLVRTASRPEEHDALVARLRDVIAPVGREHVRRTLEAAWAELARVFPGSPARDRLSSELQRLERSYG